MSKNWPTRYEDVMMAESIMESYAQQNNADTLGLFEVVVNSSEKRLDFQLSGWVVLLAKHFKSRYGSTQGDYVTRQVITHCITQGNTLH